MTIIKIDFSITDSKRSLDINSIRIENVGLWKQKLRNFYSSLQRCVATNRAFIGVFAHLFNF